MSKKIFDILPPGYKSLKEKKEERKGIKERMREKKTRLEKKEQRPIAKKPYFVWKLAAIFVVLFLLFLIINSQAYSAITLQPFQEEKIFEGEKAIVSSQIESVNIEEGIMPGQFFEIEKTGSREFAATGLSQEEGRAKGTITIYNNYEESINLKATTRFLSSTEGKYFQMPDRVYLPGAHQEGGKSVPGTAEVEVIAMEAGEKYNIGPATFSLPGLVGSSLYYQVYAESDSPMTGGFSNQVKEISEEDIERAKESLKDQLDRQACQELEASVGEDFIFLSSAIFERTIETNCSGAVAEKKDSFHCQGTANITVLAFKKSLLRDLSRDIILDDVSASQKIIEDLLIIDNLNAYPNQAEEEMRLDFDISVAVYDDINKGKLKGAIKGKNEEEIKEIIFRSFSEVEKVKIKFWPFWIKSVPDNVERIEINIQLKK